MATTLIPFAPYPNQAFQFQVTLDGNLYTAIVTSNIYRGGGVQSGKSGSYYFNLYDLSGGLIVCRAMVSSGTVAGPYDISLVWPFFKTAVYWREINNNFEIIS